MSRTLMTVVVALLSKGIALMAGYLLERTIMIDSILGMCENEDLYLLKSKNYTTRECKDAYFHKFGKFGTYDLNASGVVIRNGVREKVYQRILIKLILPN